MTGTLSPRPAEPWHGSARFNGVCRGGPTPTWATAGVHPIGGGSMSKFRWLLAALGMALIGLVPVLVSSSSAGADPGTILKFNVMTPVTGPYVGTANPIRMVPGGGLPWMITAGTGFLSRDGRLQIHVRGLVLADSPAVPANLRGINPVPDFEAIVSCQTITGTMATVTNVSTGQFPASPRGNADIKARVKLPEPCIAPVVFVASPTGAWFAATGG